ncbi:integrase family protein [Shewanella sp. 202IG2-18]|uniref:tyrosine-type recombinase/integrase n=1 Tax=Parashewanella hymeniacidonis TaxID=2807618 RepID=UPI001961A85B|nr:integrase family protein [Parashewanella hymeniacidonis]MBM7070934.1 integrase family protein [Parashewanella hymeniacidonis]
MALTDSWLKSVSGKESDKQIEKADRDGLSVRVTRKGKVVFQMRFRHAGKPCRLDLGSYPQTSLKEVRTEVLELRAQLEKGHDPRAIRNAQKRANQEAITVNELFEQWYQNYCVQHYKYPKPMKRIFEIHISPKVGKILSDKVTLHEWLFLFEQLAKEHPGTVRHAVVITKQMTSWGRKRQLVKVNSLIEIKAKSDLKLPDNRRKRVLTDDEMRICFEAIEQMKTRPISIITLHLLFHFGCRGSELRLAKKKDFDLKNKVWTIPKENHKAGRFTNDALKRPIIDEILPLVEKAMELSPGEYLLSINGERLSTSGLEHHPIGIIRWAKKKKDIDMEPWTVHDIRRTVRTRMSRLTTNDIAEIALGHVLTGVRSIYDQYDYLEEQAVAYRAWFKCLSQILTPDTQSNVVDIKKAV